MDCNDRINNTGTNFNNSKAHLKAKFNWNLSILRLNLDNKYIPVIINLILIST